MSLLLDVSSVFFTISFLIYCVAFIMYGVAIMGRVWRNRDPIVHTKKWGKAAFLLASIGLIAHLTYFITRWIGSGHIPISNMFEFMTSLSMMIMIAFTIIFLIYRKTLLGLFAVPLVIIIMAYAAVFPQEAQPLIPSLQSWWLQVHVTMAALGESFFAIGFAAGFMYLLRTVDFNSQDKRERRQQRGVEFTFFTIIILVGFIIAIFAFRAGGYESVFSQKEVANNGEVSTTMQKVEYKLPPIVSPYQSEIVSFQSFLGMDAPLFEAPSWMHGINAGRKLNTVVWSLLAGIILYGLIRLILRKPIGRAVHPLLKSLDADDLDEITYRSIAIGFPIFTLGALIFAMMWAQIAWGRFWGWDPKEVWALITWLFYSAYLHLRLSRGWQGRKSAWLAVLGFIVVMFTLVGVNLIIAGLHSYAGTD
ncbi:cytochrome c biogenesis protein CcsA [Paenibacillus crassostreae]|uniref:Cytochrome C biogenesis protein n=1 Tax=Paenibacillus crassostreae TaxID=1763538 RepID=A0A167DJ74_9BACL|nr:cytochrome c biogenesis protein CcsA [Paenibacillus crassostreae]AOZ91402.1 c-type cytochrome biogenesis protein CcsB [Paenibacillus crassostreae]OAB74438.1 cytochrome C biogenesis protein [Paenibacillus crassostreae]